MSFLRRFSVYSFVSLLTLTIIIGLLVSRSYRSFLLTTMRGETSRFIEVSMEHHLTPEALTAPKTDPEAYAEFAALIGDLIRLDFARIKIYNTEGTIVWSDRRELIGQVFALNDELEDALSGRAVSQYKSLAKDENEFERPFRHLLETYIPLRDQGGGVYAVVAVSRNLDSLVAEIHRTQVIAWAVVLTGFVFFYLAFLRLARDASSLILKQKTELEISNKALRRSHLGTIKALAAAIDAKDENTRGHSSRVARISIELGRSMGLREADLRTLEEASLLHDVGKIGTEDRILKKSGPLSPEEWVIMKRHTVTGVEILQGVEGIDPGIMEVIAHHHERFDGTGYPGALRGESIPLLARIVMVADAYDAMRSDRPYRPARPLGETLDEFAGCSGIQFDPEVVKHLLAIAETRIEFGTEQRELESQVAAS